MLLSIITINYNNAQGLKETLESVKKQTAKNYEQIIIDGGSTDNSVEIIKQNLEDQEYKKHITYWCSEPDKGIYDAMNKGITKANGDYCLFLNSGDYFYETTSLQKVFEKQFNQDIVYCDVCLITKQGKKIRKYPEVVDFLFFVRHSINHQSILINTKLQKSMPYSMEYKICADQDFLMKAILDDKRSYKHINIVMCICDSISGLSSINKTETLTEFNKIRNRYFVELIQRNPKIMQIFFDYEIGYAGILKKIRKILLFISNHTFRRHSKWDF